MPREGKNIPMETYPEGHVCVLCGAGVREPCRGREGGRSHKERKNQAKVWRQANCVTPVRERKRRRRKRPLPKVRYANYLESPEWKKLRHVALARDGYKCRVCGSGNGLNVHHSKYPQRFGEEPVEWLVTLCIEHHGKVHSLAAATRCGITAATEQVLAGR